MPVRPTDDAPAYNCLHPGVESALSLSPHCRRGMTFLTPRACSVRQDVQSDLLPDHQALPEEGQEGASSLSLPLVLAYISLCSQYKLIPI